MKIALIHSHLNDRGGSQRYVLEIANNLKSLGVEVDVFCYEYNDDLCYPELTSHLNIQKIYTRKDNEIKISPKNNFFKKYIKSFSKYKIVKKIINTFGIDYLYSLYLVNKSSKKVTELIIDNKIEYDLLFTHEEPLSVYAAIKYKKIKNTPIYWFCYDTIEKWFLEWKEDHKSSILRRFLLKNIYFKYDKYIINKFVDKIAVLDDNMSKRYHKLYGKNPLIRRGGIPETILDYSKKNKFRERFNLSDDMVVIFSLTRFVNYRRVHDIFDMYTKLDVDVQKKLFIYISSPITDNSYYEWCIEKYSEVFESKNVQVNLDFPKNDDEMYDMYLSSDLFVFPNENQTWGHAPLEAMGCGVTALVSTGCGISEIIKNISSETVFEVSNTVALTNMIEDMVRSKSYEIISKKQKEYVRNNLTWKKVCEKYVDDFKEILGN
ncbi:glycosyltransferase family 4 protein [Celerinatantimonas yamalensis]|uniref:Glycosyltransferase family 4 protein n=1 Tax=Celerinatantimonas yamalensis TaxID=559956 RepID=A0ABW9G641_9GAMM